MGAEVLWASVCGPHCSPFSRLIPCQLQRRWQLGGRWGSWLRDPIPAGVGRVKTLTPALPPGGTALDRPVTLAVLYLCICFPVCEIQDCTLRRHNKSIHVCRTTRWQVFTEPAAFSHFYCELQPRIPGVPIQGRKWQSSYERSVPCGVSLDRPAGLGLSLGAGLWKCGVKTLWGWTLLPDCQLLYWDQSRPEPLFHSTLGTPSMYLKRNREPGWCSWGWAYFTVPFDSLPSPPWQLGLGEGAGISSPSDSFPLSDYFLVFA